VSPDLEAVRTRLAARAARARRLDAERPACAELLGFYGVVVAAQADLLDAWPRVVSADRDGPFADALDAAAAAGLAPPFARRLAGVAPGAVAARLATLESVDPPSWQRCCAAAWQGDGDASVDGHVAFLVAELLLQPFAELWTSAAVSPPAASAAIRCPRCRGLAVVARLDERGHGAARALVCGRCLGRWDVPRAVCPACGETGVEALPVFRDGDLPAVRLDACDACGVYVKAIDCTVDGHAEPVVDDLATLPLDLWAAEQGYRRVRPNLLRV